MSEDLPRILYVDDDGTWLRAMKSLLGGAGFEVVTFDGMTAAKAHFVAHESELALVLTDGSISRSNDGRQWAAELHSAGKKVVLLSGGSGVGDVPFWNKGQFQTGEGLVAMIRKVIAPRVVDIPSILEVQKVGASAGTDVPQIPNDC